MSGLTVREKEHWKDRIARRIDKRIEAITAGDPGFFKQLEHDARQRALESLGLSKHQAELEQLQRQKASLEKREKQIRRAMIAGVRGVAPDDVDDCCSFRHDAEIENAVRRRKTVHEDDLLAEGQLGRQVLELRAERENLLDTVWLATSGTEIRALWAKVTELLSAQPTQLERDALAIEPARDE